MALDAEPTVARIEELEALVYEQPANLDKVAQWSRAAARGERFASIRGRLAAAQRLGIEDRRARRFVSRLPR
jgi:hypothetical protein